MLKAISPLNGFSEVINQVEISEVTGKDLYSIAIPDNGLASAKAAIKKALNCTLPNPGEFQTKLKTAKSKNQLLWMARDQFFLLSDADPKRSAAGLAKSLGNKTYVTNQSDSWCMIKVAGSRSREALERICPLNLHADKFGANAAMRTSMEHLGAIILRQGKDEFLLMSARSSAKSFLHAITQSAENI